MSASSKISSTPIRAVILAAGYATRLYPLTLGIPKPLLQITREKTVIDFIVDNILSCGSVRDITVVTNHKFSADFAAWVKGHPKKKMITVCDDRTSSNEDRLGAIGDIYYCMRKRRISSDLLVVGGDNLFDHGFDGFVRFARRVSPCVSLGLYDIKEKEQACRFGVVSIDSGRRVVRFEEKPEKPRSTLVATCLYYFPAQTLCELERYALDKTTSNDASGNYIRWLTQKSDVYGFAMSKGYWFDIGHLDSYKEVVAKYNGKLP